MPPLVRPIRRPRPLFGGHAGRRSMGLEICRVDHHGLLFAVLGGQICHHPGEDAFLAPPLPSAVERLMRTILLRRIPPTQAIAIDEDNAAQNPPAIDPRLTMRLGWGRKGPGVQSARRSARRDRSCHRSVFKAVNHAVREKSMHPDPKFGFQIMQVFQELHP